MNAEILMAYPGVDPELAALLAESPDVSDVDLDGLQRSGEALQDDHAWCSDVMKGYFVNEMLLALKEEGLSQSDLADRLGKSKQYVSKVLTESKRINYTIETMNMLAHALNRRLDLVVGKRTSEDLIAHFRHIREGQNYNCTLIARKGGESTGWADFTPSVDPSDSYTKIRDAGSLLPLRNQSKRNTDAIVPVAA